MDPTAANLIIDNKKLDLFCQQLINRSRDITKTHESLVTLEAFITQFTQDSQGSAEFSSTIDTLHKHSDHTRNQLLSEKAEQLSSALRALDKEKITKIHLPLSRNGFYEIMKKVITNFTQLEVSIIEHWANQWTSYARQKAELASGFPEALDFKKAGIKFEEYQAMIDIDNYLTNLI